MTDDAERIDDVQEFREALDDLVGAAQRGDVDDGAIVGLLTMYLAGLRGQVRLPLGMEPNEARPFADRLEDYVGETVEVDLVVTEDVISDLRLQLSAFEDER